MFDIKLIRENSEEVKRMIEKRNSKFPLDELVIKDKEWRAALQEFEKLKCERNKVTKEIAEKKDEKKIKQMQKIKDEIKSLEEKAAKLETDVQKLLMKCPNMLDAKVPKGKDDSENPVIRTNGKIEKKNFELKAHGELAEELGIANFEKAATVTGKGFNYLMGDLALLDLALQRFAIDFLIKKGHTLVLPPYLLGKNAYEKMIDISDFENVMFKIENEDNYLIATAEAPLIALYSNEVIAEENLPIKMVGFSSAFRKEMGAHGVDTRGIFRMKQFNKVEQIVICKPEDSPKMFEQMHKNIEEIFEQLKIPTRTIEICSGDISIKNARQYDLEAWFPRQEKYAEVGSTSNCTDFQSRGLNIKYGKRGGDKAYVHVLNATGLATSRAMVAILENYQNKDGSITIPEVLKKYMNGKDKITKQK